MDQRRGTSVDWTGLSGTFHGSSIGLGTGQFGALNPLSVKFPAVMCWVFWNIFEFVVCLDFTLIGTNLWKPA